MSWIGDVLHAIGSVLGTNSNDPQPGDRINPNTPYVGRVDPGNPQPFGSSAVPAGNPMNNLSGLPYLGSGGMSETVPGGNGLSSIGQYAGISDGNAGGDSNDPYAGVLGEGNAKDTSSGMSSLNNIPGLNTPSMVDPALADQSLGGKIGGYVGKHPEIVPETLGTILNFIGGQQAHSLSEQQLAQEAKAEKDRQAEAMIAAISGTIGRHA